MSRPLTLVTLKVKNTKSDALTANSCQTRPIIALYLRGTSPTGSSLPGSYYPCCPHLDRVKPRIVSRPVSCLDSYFKMYSTSKYLSITADMML